jgi:hypothetical protein
MPAFRNRSPRARSEITAMKLRFRDIISKPDIDKDEAATEPVERRAHPALPKRKHSDYPPPRVPRWEPSDFIQPPSKERLRAGR